MVGVLLVVPLLGGLVASLALDYSFRPWVVAALLAVALLAVLAVTLPLGRATQLRIVDSQERVDEREAIFHRFYRLEPGTPEFEEYYRQHPEKRGFDDQVRALPPLAHPEARTYHHLASPFQAAAFEVLETITREIDWQPEPTEGTPVQASPEELTRRLKGFAHYLGADLVGTTKLNPAYVYSHIGRSPGEWVRRSR